MFSKNDDKKTSIFGAMKCSNCGKEIGKEEQLTLKVKAKDLKGYTHLANWADAQYKLCEDCGQ
ncbi:hypothetical protein WL278_06895 [Staphylococcus caprae]|uniref:hypothetical protein n=1 Tax=Staphylococcus TaxID=1279 RepID=UPI0008AA41E5|nr:MULTISPECIES: hypothetical protein [Staphylococcus]MCI2955373.1 hypothetical protein [Staphylococcus caprae]OHS41424.1 hypothetical protein HMPREF3264_02070 [Staphylococcus sp. HMSC62A08]